ncbi:unnamed protein product [Musa banksii]
MSPPSAATPRASSFPLPPLSSIYCGRGDKNTAKGKQFKHSFYALSFLPSPMFILSCVTTVSLRRGRGTRRGGEALRGLRCRPRLPRRTASTTERSSRSKSMSPSSPSPREPCSSLVF